MGRTTAAKASAKAKVEETPKVEEKPEKADKPNEADKPKEEELPKEEEKTKEEPQPEEAAMPRAQLEDEDSSSEVPMPRKKRGLSSSASLPKKCKGPKLGLGGPLQIVKQEVPPVNEIRKMTAKLHYMKQTGNSTAYDEYHSKDTEGKRAWFFDIYKADPRLQKYCTVGTVRSTFRTFCLCELWFTFSIYLSSIFV